MPTICQPDHEELKAICRTQKTTTVSYSIIEYVPNIHVLKARKGIANNLKT